MATHCSILAWKIPWTEEPSGLRSRGSQSRTQLSMHATIESVRLLELEETQIIIYSLLLKQTWARSTGVTQELVQKAELQTQPRITEPTLSPKQGCLLKSQKLNRHCSAEKTEAERDQVSLPTGLIHRISDSEIRFFFLT